MDLDWHSEAGAVALRLLDPHVLCEGMRRVSEAIAHTIVQRDGYTTVALHVTDRGMIILYASFNKVEAAEAVFNVDIWPREGGWHLDAYVTELARPIMDELREAAEQAGGFAVEVWRRMVDGKMPEYMFIGSKQ